MFIDKKRKRVESANGQSLERGAFGEKYPAIWEYMTATVGSGGTARTTSTLLLFVEDGAVKVCVNDRDREENAFWSEQSLEAVLEAVEVDLSAGQGDWRKSTGKKRKFN